MKSNTLLMGLGVVAVAVVGIFAYLAMQSQPTQEPTTMIEQRTPETMETGASKTIVDVAVEAGTFTTLVTAIQAAGLVDTLSTEGPFTVFAPTDEAFAALPEGTVEALLNDTDKLTEILTYHVVPGKVMAGEVVNLNSATTVQGQAFSISVENGTVMVNDATVVATDIEASNGVIHVIDSVLLP
jgi:uncharacterized surface protein with fasciclin (FAS1) repeats